MATKKTRKTRKADIRRVLAASQEADAVEFGLGQAFIEKYAPRSAAAKKEFILLMMEWAIAKEDADRLNDLYAEFFDLD